MSDLITKCVVYKNPDDSIQYYEITFSFENVNVPLGDCLVRIAGSELLNPTDLVELKKVACQRASITKTWYSHAIMINGLNGPVSL